MSWIVGYFGHDIAAVHEAIGRISLSPILTVRRPRLLILAGGIPETLRQSPGAASADEGWIVTGTAVIRHGAGCRFLRADDWDNILRKPTPPLSDLNGHFVAVRWNPRCVEAFNDQLGLRTLYALHARHGVLFSTRMDWLSKIRGGSQLNLATFGARWLLINQLNYRSPLDDMERLAVGGTARMTPDQIEIRNTSWSPKIVEGDSKEYEDALVSFTHPETDRSGGISVGLSGGWDSRLLLAHLLDHRKDLSVHTFGDRNHPDVQVASAIAAAEHLPLFSYDEPLPDGETAIRLVSEFEAATGACEPASTSMLLRYNEVLYRRNVLVLDGGFGEFGRRKYFNRLLYLGRRSLLRLDAVQIARYLRVERARVFNAGANAAMEGGALEQLRGTLECMPPIRKIGPENFADLFIVRTRLPNWSESDQSRIDGQVPNYMPYAQPLVLHSIFGLPIAQRRHGRLHRSILLRLRPDLAHYPLVKAGTTHPYRLGTVSSTLWTKLKSKAGYVYRDPIVHAFLDRLRDFVLETAHSTSVRTFGAYDMKSVTGLVDGYYGGRKELARQVDWWLAFELWRQAAL